MVEKPSKEYCYQLTDWKKSEKELDFALVQFENSEERSCCVREENEMFALFTMGVNYPKED